MILKIRSQELYRVVQVSGQAFFVFLSRDLVLKLVNLNGGMLTFLGQALSKVSDKFYQLVTDYKPLGLSDFVSYSIS